MALYQHWRRLRDPDAGAAYLRVRDANGTIVDERHVTLSIGAPARGEALLELTLAPGRYTVEAFYYSAADGSIQGIGDHEITVS